MIQIQNDTEKDCWQIFVGEPLHVSCEIRVSCKCDLVIEQHLWKILVKNIYICAKKSIHLCINLWFVSAFFCCCQIMSEHEAHWNSENSRLSPECNWGKNGVGFCRIRRRQYWVGVPQNSLTLNIGMEYFSEYFAEYFCRMFLQDIFAEYFCRISLQKIFAGYFCRIFLQDIFAEYFCRIFLQDILQNIFAKYFAEIGVGNIGLQGSRGIVWLNIGAAAHFWKYSHNSGNISKSCRNLNQSLIPPLE